MSHAHIIQVIKSSTGLPCKSFQVRPVGGGNINEAYEVVIDKSQKFFCKTNSSQKFPGLFKAEKKGLEKLQTQQLIRIPKVVACEEIDNQQILVLEWIEQGLKTSKFWKSFGEQLAALHHVSSQFFGLDENNYMGALPQYNQPWNNWCDFFIEQRLMLQVKLAIDRGLLSDDIKFENLYRQLPNLFAPEPPSLQHGDLWSGNFLCDDQSMPVLIDPAIYFGHRSVDLGMTTLFGGFERAFYESYHYCYPLPYNHWEQWEVCNLYPLLIHLNLFGKSYLGDILGTIQRY